MSTVEKRQALRLLDFIDEHCLAQVIEKPIRENILDLILTNNEDLVHSTGVDDLGISDHRMLRAALRFQKAVPHATKESSNFEVLNFWGKVDWTASCRYSDSRAMEQDLKEIAQQVTCTAR